MMKKQKEAKREKQKVKGSAFCLFALTFIFCTLALWLSGCRSYEQMGETAAEGQRRHIRNAQLNRQQMMEDIDNLMLYDKPSKLSDKRIP